MSPDKVADTELDGSEGKGRKGGDFDGRKAGPLSSRVQRRSAASRKRITSASQWQHVTLQEHPCHPEIQRYAHPATRGLRANCPAGQADPALGACPGEPREPAGGSRQPEKASSGAASEFMSRFQFHLFHNQGIWGGKAVTAGQNLASSLSSLCPNPYR